MPIELRIRWQGDVRGLANMRLSLSAFGEPLNLLLVALRRIATNLVTDAFEDKNVGRFANAARQLDIEIVDLVRESSGFDSVITLAAPALGDNLELFQNLAENAAVQLVDAIEAERKGVLKNASVRKYLRSLPTGIVYQSYRLRDNGRALRDIEFGEMSIPTTPPDLPYIAHYTGSIVGVGFEPGKPEVKVRTASGTVTLSATTEQVDKALELRGSDVLAVVVDHGSSHRLLILQRADAPINRSTRDEAVFARWDGVLRRLAL